MNLKNNAASALLKRLQHQNVSARCAAVAPASILGPLVLALFAVGDVYVSLCKKSAYAPFTVRRRS